MGGSLGVTSAWLLAQGAYAIGAWGFAARAVWQSAVLVGLLSAPLASRVLAWRRANEDERARAFAREVHNPVISLLMEVPLEEGELADDRLADALAMAAPPSKALRGMATIGTLFGLFAAIGMLRSAGADARVAPAAFECALLGFVTAIPLWTAVAVCGVRARRITLALERLALAIDGETQAEDASRDDPRGAVSD